MSLTPEQIKELLKPVDPERVKKDDGKGFSYLEAWDVRRTMNRIFGFGNWSADVTEMVLVRESETTTRKGAPAWNIVYRARCVLRIGDMFGDRCSYTEWAAGENTNPSYAEAHDQAIKTAESQAFKRCAMNLGDQFGLSLYNNGSMKATVSEIVNQEYADSDKVESWIESMAQINDEEALMSLAHQLRGAEISSEDHARLTDQYKAAQARIKAA